MLQLRETSRGGCLAARLQPGLRLAGRESGGAGEPRGCVCLSIHAESSLSQVRVTPVSGCGDSTRGLTDPLPGRGAPNPVSISLGNSENGPARTSQAVRSTPRSPLQELSAAVTAVQAARSRAWPRLPGLHPRTGQRAQYPAVRSLRSLRVQSQEPRVKRRCWPSVVLSVSALQENIRMPLSSLRTTSQLLWTSDLFKDPCAAWARGQAS